MKKCILLLALALSNLIFGGCVQSPQSVPGSVVIPPFNDGSSHILVPTELIDIKVFQEPDLSTSARIPEDGRINFPMIGEVVLAGKTVQQATRLISGRLEAKFIANPQVTLTVVEHARKLFTILGQVQRAGTYKFPDRESINLLQAIGIAGGYTPLADPAKVTLKRRVAGKETVFRLDAKRMAKDASTPVNIESGDIITVGERLF
jgi:polysaccharide export outer membrane protein